MFVLIIRIHKIVTNVVMLVAARDVGMLNMVLQISALVDLRVPVVITGIR